MILDRCARWSVRHRAAVLLGALALLIAGERARRGLPQDAIADISDPQIVLVAEWPLRPASEVDARLVAPLAKALQGVAGARAVRGSAMAGLGYLDVVFDDAAELGRGRAEIARRVATLRPQLPSTATVTVGPLASSTGWVLQYALISDEVRQNPHSDESGRMSLLGLRRHQDEVLKPALSGVPGVAEVASLGGDALQGIVGVRPQRLRDRGLAFSQVVDRLRASLRDQSAPALSPEGLRTLPLVPVEAAAAAGQTPVVLDDIGQLRFVPAMTEGMADVNGHFPVVAGIVVAARQADPRAVIQGVRRRIEELRASLPAGVELVVLYDRSELAGRVNATLLRALAEEMAVVAVVVLVFLLHGRTALVPLATLLVVLSLTFLGMRALGLPATVMSLGGIAIALGMAVDAELVAVEACHRWLETDPPKAPSARQARLLAAASAFSPAILTSLVVAGVTFLPALVFPGETGRLLGPLVISKTLVIAAATLVTLLVAPALRSLLLRGRIRPELDNPLTRLLVRGYRPVVAFALARPWLTLTTAGLAALSCLPLLGGLGAEFLTRIDEGELLYMPTTAADVTPEVAGEQLRQQNQRLIRRPEVAMVFGKVGRAATATDPAPHTMIETVIRLKPRRSWPRPMATADLVSELDQLLRAPGWTNAWTAPVRARLDMMATGMRTPVGVRVVSARARSLPLVQELRAILSEVPGTRSVSAESPGGGQTVLRFEPDLDALARHGADAALVRETAALVLAGGQIGHLVRDGRRLPVRVMPDLDPRAPEELLREATVPGASGAPVPLALLGRVRPRLEPAVLRTEGGRSASYVHLDIEHGTDIEGYVERARGRLEQAMADGQLSLLPGEALEWTGQYEVMAEGRRRLLVIAPLVLLMMVGLLVLQFRSWTEALIVLGAVPLALVGSVWTIFLLDYPLSPPVWVGLISVVGLAMQTAVVMVVYIDAAFFRRVRAGQLRSREDIVAAHAEGTVRRLRPKLMTVMALAAALLPLLWASGAGAEIMKRVAAPMVGGLLFSTFVTLEVLPVLYTMWRHRQLLQAQRRGVGIEVVVGAGPRWAADAASVPEKNPSPAITTPGA